MRRAGTNALMLRNCDGIRLAASAQLEYEFEGECERSRERANTDVTEGVNQ